MTVSFSECLQKILELQNRQQFEALVVGSADLRQYEKHLCRGLGLQRLGDLSGAVREFGYALKSKDIPPNLLLAARANRALCQSCRTGFGAPLFRWQAKNDADFVVVRMLELGAESSPAYYAIAFHLSSVLFLLHHDDFASWLLLTASTGCLQPDLLHRAKARLQIYNSEGAESVRRDILRKLTKGQWICIGWPTDLV